MVKSPCKSTRGPQLAIRLTFDHTDRIIGCSSRGLTTIRSSSMMRDGGRVVLAGPNVLGIALMCKRSHRQLPDDASISRCGELAEDWFKAQAGIEHSPRVDERFSLQVPPEIVRKLVSAGMPRLRGRDRGLHLNLLIDWLNEHKDEFKEVLDWVRAPRPERYLYALQPNPQGRPGLLFTRFVPAAVHADQICDANQQVAPRAQRWSDDLKRLPWVVFDDDEEGLQEARKVIKQAEDDRKKTSLLGVALQQGPAIDLPPTAVRPKRRRTLTACV